MMDKQRPFSYPELEKEREISLVLKSYETLLADALTEYSAVEDIPEEAKRKIHNRLYAEARRSQALRRAKRVGNAAAVFLLIFLLAAAILCVSVAGIRESITDFWMEHTGYRRWSCQAAGFMWSKGTVHTPMSEGGRMKTP